MTEPEARKRATAPADTASLSALGWTPIWAMPNVMLDEPVEASHAALVPTNDARLREVARRYPAFDTLLNAFRNEFGVRVSLWRLFDMRHDTGLFSQLECLRGLSGRNHGGVTLLARKFMQRSVEGDQRRLQFSRIGQ